MNSRPIVATMLIGLGLGWLVACAGASPAGPATATLAPPAGPALPGPTEAPTPAFGVTPTSVVPAGVSLQTYLSPDQRFSIDYPANWQPFERDNGVVFLDPGAQAGYGVYFQDIPEPYTAAELADFATAFVTTNYGDDPGFQIVDRADDLLGASIIDFRSADDVLGPAMNEAIVTQFGTSVYLVVLSVTEEQWALSADALRQLTNSLQVNPAPAAAAVTPALDEPPQLNLYVHSSGHFGFVYATDWSLDEEETSVRVTSPGGDFTFLVELIPQPGAGEDLALSQEHATAYVDRLAAQFPDLQRLPPTEFSLSGTTGSTIDYVYTDEAGALQAGSIIVVGHKDEFQRVILASPAAFWDTALEWFNVMMQGYRILEESELATPGTP